MYAHSFLVTSVRGIGVEPTTVASCALGVIAFMNAAFGVRLAPDFLAFFLAPDFADFLAPPLFAAPFFAEDFFAAPFFAPFFAVFFAAMLVSWECEQVLTQRETLYDGAQDTMPSGGRNREDSVFPYGEADFPSGIVTP
jgi:hypothetical protein